MIFALTMIVGVLIALVAFVSLMAAHRKRAALVLAVALLGGLTLGALGVATWGLRARPVIVARSPYVAKVPIHDYHVDSAGKVIHFDARLPTAQEPIDALWARLNEPQIDLEDPQPPPKKEPTDESEEAEPANEVSRERKRPEWVDDPPKLVGSVQRVVVSVGPYATLKECHRELGAKLHQAVLTRAIDKLEQLHGPGVGVPTLETMGLGIDYILRELCVDEFVETVDSSVGEMKQAHVLLEFNQTQDEAIVEQARRDLRRQGIATTAAVGASVLGCVALAFGLMQVDTWTRGYYTKRLFLGVPATIIAVLGLLSIVGV